MSAGLHLLIGAYIHILSLFPDLFDHVSKKKRKALGTRIPCAKVWHIICDDHLDSMFNILAVTNGPDFCLQTCVFLKKSVMLIKPQLEV